MSLRIAAGTMVFLWLLGATTTFVDDSGIRLVILISLNVLRLGLVFWVWKSAVAWTLRTIGRGDVNGTLDAVLKELELEATRQLSRGTITQIAADAQPGQPNSH